MTESISYSVRPKTWNICCDLFEDFSLDTWHWAHHNKLAAPTAADVPRLHGPLSEKKEVSELLPHPMYKLRKTPEAVSKTANPNLKIKTQPSEQFETEWSARIIVFCASAQSRNPLKKSTRVSRKNWEQYPCSKILCKLS